MTHTSPAWLCHSITMITRGLGSVVCQAAYVSTIVPSMAMAHPLFKCGQPFTRSARRRVVAAFFALSARGVASAGSPASGAALAGAGPPRPPVPRQSASLILIARSAAPLPRSSDYRVLLVRRSTKSSAMAGAYVMPGGVVDAVDRELAKDLPHMVRVCVCACVRVCAHARVCVRVVCVPPPSVCVRAWCARRDPHPRSRRAAAAQLNVKPELAVCALRETFEEAGLAPGLDAGLDAGALAGWVARAAGRPAGFREFVEGGCAAGALAGAVTALLAWAHFVTPDFEARRYDTTFFAAFARGGAGGGSTAQSGGETTAHVWLAPEEALDGVAAGTLFLPPPQVCEA